MKRYIFLLLCLPLLGHGHSSHISTLVLVKDQQGRWSAHLSSSQEAFQTALGHRQFRSADEFQQTLIRYIQGAVHIRTGFFNTVQLTDGQCRMGHQTDLKFLIGGIPQEARSLTVEDERFEKMKDHFIVFKVIDDKRESNQFVLEEANDFSASVNFGPDGISIVEADAFNYYYLLFIPLLLLMFMIKNPMKKYFQLVIVTSFLLSCSKDTTVAPSTDLTVPAPFKKIYGAASIASDGTYIIIKTKDLPDHPSPYYPSTNSLYQPYSGTTFGGLNFIKNPNSIMEQSGTFKIPVNPKVASNHVATPLGPIGIALNGVPFFNQYAGPNNQELKGEMATFDQYYGHPQQSGIYHYHVEPLYLTTVKSTRSGLMGFLLDGFPVYGPLEESGLAVSNADLDVYHGHTHATIDYPDGIYHYHFTTEAPYLNGNGFYGTPGTISQ